MTRQTGLELCCVSVVALHCVTSRARTEEKKKSALPLFGSLPRSLSFLIRVASTAWLAAAIPFLGQRVPLLTTLFDSSPNPAQPLPASLLHRTYVVTTGRHFSYSALPNE